MRLDRIPLYTRATNLLGKHESGSHQCKGYPEKAKTLQAVFTFQVSRYFPTKLEWADTRPAIIAALGMLQEFVWIQEVEIRPVTGRPSIIYHVHPEVFK